MSELRLADAFRRLATDLDTVGARWALVGGLAVSARAEPRTTRDVDVAIATSDELDAEAIVRRLRDLGYVEESVLLQEAADRIAAVRLARRGERAGLLCDLLFASSGIETEIVAEAEPLEILPGLVCPVATTGHLLAMKTLALRPDRPQDRAQDFTDLRELFRVAGQDEIRRARAALRVITRRGFDRGIDLIARFESQLEQFEKGTSGFSG